MSRDPFAHYDAAYVLGALSPSDRDAYEEHVRSCPDCASALREVAGLPGLLGRVTASDLDSLDERPEPPADLLPALLTAARRERRRGRARLLAAAAATVVAVATISAAVTSQLAGPDRTDAASPGAASPGASSPGPSSAGVPTQEMRVLQDAGVSASVAVEPVRWGTRLTLTCRYRPSAAEEYPADGSYVLVVTTPAGRERVASWRALPGRTMTVTAATATRSEDITAVEVRSADGDPLLRLG